MFTLNLQFQYLHYASLFLGVVVLFLFLAKQIQWRKQVAKKIGEKELVNALTKSYSSKKFITKFILTVIAFALGVVALMNPRVPSSENELSRKGIDVVIALDVSNSMLAADGNMTRLEKAKSFIKTLMNALPQNRYALVLFAGNSFLQMPLTFDVNAAALFIEGANPSSVSQQGTNISDAMEKSASFFSSIGDSYKTILLVTDGEEHEPQALVTAEKMRSEGVMVNTVGVGSITGVNFLDPTTGKEKINEEGLLVYTQLNEELLRQIASTTHGNYVHLTSTEDAVKQFKNTFETIDQSDLKDNSLVNYKSLYMFFAGGMFLLLFFEPFISERKKNEN